MRLVFERLRTPKPIQNTKRMKSLFTLLAIFYSVISFSQVPSDAAVLLKSFDSGEEFPDDYRVEMKTSFLYIPMYNEEKKELKIYSYNHFSNEWYTLYKDTTKRDVQFGKVGYSDLIILTSKTDNRIDFIKILKVKNPSIVEHVYAPELETPIWSFYPYFGSTQFYAFADDRSLWQIDLKTDKFTEHKLPSPDGRTLWLYSQGFRAVTGDLFTFMLEDYNKRRDFLTYNFDPINGFEFLSDDDREFRSYVSTEKYHYMSISQINRHTRYRTERGKFDPELIYDDQASGRMWAFKDHSFLLYSTKKKIYVRRDHEDEYTYFNGLNSGSSFLYLGEDLVTSAPSAYGKSWFVFDMKTGKITANGITQSRGSIYAIPHRKKMYQFDYYSTPHNLCMQMNEDGTSNKIGLQFTGGDLSRKLTVIYSDENIYYLYKKGDKFYIGTILETHSKLSVSCFLDDNANGVLDSEERILSNSGVQLIDLQTESVHELDNDGIYLPKYAGHYKLQPKAPPLYKITTENEVQLHINRENADTLIHVGIKSVKDTVNAELFLNRRSFRCGFPGTVKNTMANTGTTNFSGVVSVKYHSAISIKSFDIQPDSSKESTYYWTIANLKPYEKWSVKAALRWPGVNHRRQSITITTKAQLSSKLSEATFQDVSEGTMGCAYDPNDKAVTPDRPDHDGAILPGEALTYKIRFQNTGNDTAFNVRLVDTLSKHLSWETFRVLDKSHDMNTKLSKDGVVEFMFNNILLPDSNRDEPNSHGYVIYRIQPLKNLPVLSEITNKADIYFDYNPPITTNTTKSVYRDYLVSNKGPKLETELFSIYPNPTKDMVLVEFNKGEVAQVKVISSDGRVQLAQTIQSGEQLDLSQLHSGLYFLEAKVDGKTQIAKVLKQ